jgi:hypothetical protein
VNAKQIVADGCGSGRSDCAICEKKNGAEPHTESIVPFRESTIRFVSSPECRSE